MGDVTVPAGLSKAAAGDPGRDAIERAIQAVAENMLRRYDSEHDASHLTWRDFMVDAREDVAATGLAEVGIERDRAVAEVERVRQAAAATGNRVEQTLGTALGYPLMGDEVGGGPGEVAVGDHVPESVAMEAAERIAGLGAEVERLRAALEKLATIGRDGLPGTGVGRIAREALAPGVPVPPKENL